MNDLLIEVVQDGNSWIAQPKGTCLADNVSGFGDTPKKALQNFVNQMEEK